MRESRMLVKLELMTSRGLLIMNGIFCGALLISIIVGATGPPSYISTTRYAYNCPDGNHLGLPCVDGVYLANSTTYVTKNYSPLSPLNQFFGVSFRPFSAVEGDFSMDYDLAVDGLNSENEWIPIGSKRDNSIFYCQDPEEDEGACTFETLYGVSRIEFEYYRLQFRAVEEACVPGSCLSDWLRDGQFDTFTISDSYTRFRLGFSITGSILAMVAFVTFWWKLGSHLRSETSGAAPVTSEQYWVLAFLFVLFLENDPLFGTRTVTNGWFLDLTSTLFEVVFDAMLLLFWLISADGAAARKSSKSPFWFYFPKLLLTGIWALLSFIAYSWLRSRHIFDPLIEQDPVFSKKIYPMLIVTEIFYFLIIVYIAYMIVSSWEANAQFYYLVFPTFVIVVSILVSMFSGLTKDIETSSLAYLYYFVLRNAYIYILLYGHWPAESFRTASNPVVEEIPGEGGENRRLIGSQKNPFGSTN